MTPTLWLRLLFAPFIGLAFVVFLPLIGILWTLWVLIQRLQR